MLELLQQPAILISSIITLVAISLYFDEYFERKRSSEAQKKIFQETKQKSAELLQAAEEAQTNLLSQGDFVTKQLITKYSDELSDSIKNSGDSISAAQGQLITFMQDLQKRSSDFEEASKVSTEKRISQLFERLEEKLSDFLIQTEQKTASSIELELKSVRQLIETYKNAQLKMIDENIVAMMEQTLSIILTKKLSLKDQLDLIYEALEKAKVEKFIV